MNQTRHKSDNLSHKQAKFVREYTIDYNGSAAAIRAGYNKKSSRAIASKLLTKQNIQAAINDQESREITLENFRREDIAKLAFIEATRVDETSSHSARVAAIGLLARIHGLLNIGEGEVDTTRKYSFVMNMQSGKPINANRPGPNIGPKTITDKGQVIDIKA